MVMNKNAIIALSFAFIVLILAEIIGLYYTYRVLHAQDEQILNLKMNLVLKGLLRQTRGRLNEISYTISRPAVFFTKIGKNVSRSEYHDILQMNLNPLLTSINTIVWIPKIYFNEKEGYESFLRSQDVDNFTIHEYNTTDGSNYPVEDREYYFPYAYSEPQNLFLDSVLTGFDLYSDPTSKTFIDYALLSSNSTGSFRFQLINTTNPYNYGVILNKISFNNIQSTDVDDIMGIVMAIINVGDIMTISLGNLDLSTDRNDMDVMVFDITYDNVTNNNNMNVSLLYKENKPEYANIWFKKDIPQYDYFLSGTINVANRTWMICLRFLDTFVKKNSEITKMYIVISISIALFFFDIFLLILAYQKFQETEKREIANKMLGYVNHEVRNPLNVITGMIDITIGTLNEKIKSNDEKTEIKNDEIYSIMSDLYTAESSCHMLKHIVNDILDIRKLEENKLEINNDWIKLDKFCKNLNKTITPKLLEKIDLKFVITIDHDLENSMIYIDRMRLEQILLNFIFNSIKFTVSGIINLNIKKKEKMILFEVRDTGRGIDDESKKMIFQPFRQTKREDASRYGGIGLGLYLCKMLVNCMQGTIGFESILSKGSVFYIELPLKMKLINDVKNLHPVTETSDTESIILSINNNKSE